MEWSQLDNVRGKRFWSGNTPEAPSFPNQYYPAHGVIAKENGVETLTVYSFVKLLIMVRISMSGLNSQKESLMSLN